ncbi:MAG TPA: PP2C family protein-serine/threonine phosphatase [Thermoanaerobaculia bacterium]|nr:PP2C family protein-serine/threonine phosphatase [Thermoanaerobaculia bacterium]
MAVRPIEELVDLSQDQALRHHLDERNMERLRWTAISLSVIAFLTLLAYLFASSWLRLAAPLVILALSRLVFLGDESALFRRHAQAAVGVSLLALLAASVFLPPQRELGLAVVGFLGPLLLVAFHLAGGWMLFLLVVMWAATLTPHVLEQIAAGATLLAPRPVLQTVVTLLSFYFSRNATQRTAETFSHRFRVETSRLRERQRMRQELASARQIQLSMLPRTDPKVPGLDISAVSLPAAEVGGDYYEYFDEVPGRLALAIGDVAGHGVASGLLLSGIRSCLYLLNPERPEPRDLFERLDRMVRHTTERRMFITLLYTVFDLERRALTFSTAGHPAPMHVRKADGSVVELDAAAPPLGTRLGAVYSQREVPFEVGDVFLFYTDGLTETLDPRGEVYGDERLRRRLARVAPGKDARIIREALLSDAWNFKGDEEQHDDITLVVVRVS